MRSIVTHFAPFVVGALVGLGFGIAVTRRGFWPNIHYRILEMEPIARNLSMLGLLLLGSGFGCTFATIIKSIGEGDIEFSPTQPDRFAGHRFSVAAFLAFSGLVLLACANYMVG